MNARFSGLVKKVQNCSQSSILAPHISTWTIFLLIFLRKVHSTSEIAQHEKNPNKSVSWSHMFFHSLVMYQLTRNGDKLQIRLNPSLSLSITSFMHRPSLGDPHRTSNISHKTHKNRKSATKIRNVLLLTKTGHSLLL